MHRCFQEYTGHKTLASVVVHNDRRNSLIADRKRLLGGVEPTNHVVEPHPHPLETVPPYPGLRVARSNLLGLLNLHQPPLMHDEGHGAITQTAQ